MLSLCYQLSMPKRSSKNPDVNQIAHQGLQSILEKLDPESLPKPKEKNPAAVALGKLGGAKGVNYEHD